MFAMTHTITINEEQRQLLLLALAWLSLERPGFELALRGCAEQVPGGAEMFGTFREIHADRAGEA